MAFSELDRKRIDKHIGEYLRNRVPPAHRDKLRYEYRIEDNNVYLSEVRPRWKDPDRWQAADFAKLRYIKSRNLWKLYWMRASGKWELYEPHPEARDLKTFVDTIDKDRLGCFFG